MKAFRMTKILTGAFVAAMVSIALTTGKTHLAIAGIATGVLILVLVKRRTKEVLVDERMDVISGRAARLTYVITTVFLAFLSLFLKFVGQRTSEIYLESLGTVLAYVVCLSVGVYSMSYKYLDRKYSGDCDE